MKQEYLQELGLSPETAGQIAAEFARELDQARGEWENGAGKREKGGGPVQIALAQAAGEKSESRPRARHARSRRPPFPGRHAAGTGGADSKRSKARNPPLSSLPGHRLPS